MDDRPSNQAGTILIVGASRGLGYAMAEELAARGWTVVGTEQVHGSNLNALAARHPGRVGVEAVDITRADQIAALRQRLSGRRLDILFVNAGTANRTQGETIADVSDDDFVRVMVTNALGVMRTVEALQDLVPPDGLIGVMSSGQGSIGNNTKGGHEVYRGSKAALNQYMRSHAARHADGRRAMLLMAPGWIRTDLGGPDATFGVEETIPEIVDVLLAQRGRPGLRFLDRKGQTVPW